MDMNEEVYQFIAKIFKLVAFVILSPIFVIPSLIYIFTGKCKNFMVRIESIFFD